MSTLPYFSSVPGMAVPGMAQPGRDQRFSYPLYLYAGLVALCYLDYLDTVTSHTLTVAPGGYYTMAAANSRAGLTVPPPGGRWDTGTGREFRIVRVAPVTPEEIRAARERSLAAHGHYPGSECRHCDPAPAEPVPVVRRTPGPDCAPQPSMAQVRADLERARIAHGHYAPGGCRLCLSGGHKDEAVVV